MSFTKNVSSDGCYDGRSLSPLREEEDNEIDSIAVELSSLQIENLANVLNTVVNKEIKVNEVIAVSKSIKNANHAIKEKGLNSLACSKTHVFFHKKKQVGRGYWKTAFESKAIELTTGTVEDIIRLKADLKEGPSTNECINHQQFSSHPNVVKLYAYRKYEKAGIRIDNSRIDPAPIERLQMYVEKCDRTLEAANKDPTFTFIQKVKVMKDAASAVAYMHSEGYNHCDLKPDNILLKGTIGKLTDFGVCTKTRTNTCMNETIIPPEQKGRGRMPQATNACDVYQFGLSLWITFHPRGAQIEPVIGQKGFILPPPKERFKDWPTSTEQERRILDLILQCIDSNPINRPTMQYIEQTLGAIWLEETFHLF